jgi:phosphoribosylformylglycinamidine synthase
LCQTVQLEVASARSALTAGVGVGTRLRIPINHFEGNYTCDQRTLDELRAEERVVLRYTDNPNGSVDDIAGVSNPAGNVVGLMPHPERASNPLLGSTDGRVLLGAFLESAGACLSPPVAAGSPGGR